MDHCILSLPDSLYFLTSCPYSWWLQSLWLCQEHVLQWGTLARLCFVKKFISSLYSLMHHSSFYKQGGDPQEDEMGISGGSPNEQCLQINQSPPELRGLLCRHKSAHTRAHSSSFHPRLSLFSITSQGVQHISSYPAFPPTKSREVFSQPSGTSQRLLHYLVGLVGFLLFTTKDKKWEGNQKRQHPPLKSTAFTVITNTTKPVSMLIFSVLV